MRVTNGAFGLEADKAAAANGTQAAVAFGYR
jgi:hypothetical protein